MSNPTHSTTSSGPSTSTASGHSSTSTFRRYWLKKSDLSLSKTSNLELNFYSNSYLRNHPCSKHSSTRRKRNNRHSICSNLNKHSTCSNPSNPCSNPNNRHSTCSNINKYRTCNHLNNNCSNNNRRKIKLCLEDPLFGMTNIISYWDDYYQKTSLY